MPFMKPLLTFVLLTTLAASAEPADCRWRLPGQFSENMVLQRDVPLPIWGWGPEGAPATVRLIAPPNSGLEYNHSITVTVTNGRWRAVLPPAPAGGPYSLLIEPKDETGHGADALLFTQVLVGEVWLICGQSNVLWPLDETAEGAEEIARRHELPNFRFLEIGDRMPHSVAARRATPVGFWGNPRWEEASYLAPRSSRKDIPGGPSAAGYYFGAALYRHLGGKVPVGIIQVGAIMPVQHWVPDEEVAATPGLLPIRGAIYPNATSKGFDANIAPLAGYPLRGCIYMQGESNCLPGQDEFYRHGLPALIRGWRKAWNNDQLPFLIVQLWRAMNLKLDPNEQFSMDAPQLQAWHNATREGAKPLLTVREAQRLTRQSLTNTALVVTIDVGDVADAQDAHPRHKRPIGERLAMAARKLTLGEADPTLESPLPEKAEFAGAQATVHFVNADGGLEVRGGKLVGFELAGPDGVFHPAEGTVEGAVVRLRSPRVTKVAAVRYAWAGYPQFCLYNRRGLPASPFALPRAAPVE